MFWQSYFIFDEEYRIQRIQHSTEGARGRKRASIMRAHTCAGRSARCTRVKNSVHARIRPRCCTFFEIQRKVMKYREQQAKLLMRRGPV